jgi:hypothetical protein
MALVFVFVFVFVLVGSFFIALAIGYAGVATELLLKKVADTEIVLKTGRWLLLFPLLETIQKFVSAAPSSLTKLGRTIVAIIVVPIVVFLLFWICGGIAVSILNSILTQLSDYLVGFLIIAVCGAGLLVYLTKR